MKKAALRRVIIYVLVFSLTFTSVSAVIVRPVEVQAVVGADDAALAILLALLAAGGYYASSSAAAANIKTEFLSFIGKINGTASTSTEATADIIKNTVVYSGFINLGYNSTQAFEASKHFLAATSLIEFGYTDETDRTWSVTADGDKYVISDTIGNVSWSCTVPNFKVNSVLPKNLNINLLVSEGKIPQDDPEAAAIAVGLLAELRRLVTGFIKVCFSKSASNDKVKKMNAVKDAISNAIPKNTLINTLIDYVNNDKIDCGDFKSSVVNSLLKTNSSIVEKKFEKDGVEFPSSYFILICTYDYNSSMVAYVSEDLSDYNLVFDGSRYYKVDSEGNFSFIFSAFIEYFQSLAVSDSRIDTSFSNSSNFFCDVNLTNFNALSPNYIRDSIIVPVNIDFSHVYQSSLDYVNSNDYATAVGGGNYLIGSDDAASSDDSNVYIPDMSWYEENAFNMSQLLTNQEALNKQLELTQAAYAKALEDMKDSIEEGNATTASLLQKILNALNALNTSVTTHLPLDISTVINSFAGTADVIGDIDKLLNQKLPVIGSMVDVVAGSLPAIDDIKDWAERVAGPSIDNLSKTGEEAVKSIDELGDNILAKLAPIDLLTNLDGTVDGIALDALNLNKLITETIAGDTAISVSVDDSKPIAVTVTPSVSEPTDQDGFNLGFFNLLYLLFLILFKIIMIFCHCLELLFTIHSVKAYPYFINNDMIRGLNWIKSVNITGGLLNISLYDFLFALVRIILVFSVVRLIRHYTDRLG